MPGPNASGASFPVAANELPNTIPGDLGKNRPKRRNSARGTPKNVAIKTGPDSLFSITYGRF
jgi:hypothetical protein